MKKNRRIAWLSLGVACMFSCFSCYGEHFRGKSRFASDLLATEESWVTVDPVVAADSVKDEEEVFMSTEQPPVYPGGVEAMMKYLEDNIVYPAKAKRKGISDIVMLRLLIDRTGKIAGIDVENSVDKALIKEAVRVVSKMPNWQPAKQDGKNVAVYFSLPVRFALDSKRSD